ncbi:N-acetylglucosamine-6-phosphate deacetylase [Leptolyngbya sp. PCC 6406]|uniref:N-acetylglucosamine-6-phosphate deacetylase n=1 Tax=Leptolyngbya sp. PCC 6406 TaxID=1173264 RepID=UPI0002AC2DDF|nr:N-acetylglucosamine-6-phosphate deacetylase [Leptolyngbya sp. PCC 6406]
MYALTHGTLYTGTEVLHNGHWHSRPQEDCALVIDRDRILDILPLAALPSDCPRLDLAGASVAPGFIDLQLNGCGGVMFNDAITADTLAVMHATNLRSGTTSFLPTLITAPDADMRAAIAVVQDYRHHQPTAVLGLHLEGPYLNPKRKGIHNGAYVRSLDGAMVQTLVAAGDKVVKLLTLAPEQVAAADIQRLVAAGIVVSAGHTDASYEQGMAGFDAGITMATHLFNAMSPWQSRSPGMVGAVLNRPEVYAGIIADGHHVHFPSIQLAKKLKGDHLFLVTDATPPAGTTGIESFQIGGQEVFYRQGQCVSATGTLGGSALTMIEAIAHCVHQTHISLEEALRMATLYPAQAIGVDHHLGRLAPGYWANLAVFNADLEIQAVVDRGQWHPFTPQWPQDFP